MRRKFNGKAPSALRQEYKRKAILAGLISDLSFEPNNAQRALLASAAGLILDNQLIDLARARGEPVDMVGYRLNASKLITILTKLGVRAPKPVEPETPAEPEEETLADYLRHKEAELAAQRALGFADEQDGEPETLDQDGELPSPPASDLPVEPIIAAPQEPAIPAKPLKPRQEGLEVHSLYEIAGRERKSVSQVLEERQSVKGSKA